MTSEKYKLLANLARESYEDLLKKDWLNDKTVKCMIDVLNTVDRESIHQAINRYAKIKPKSLRNKNEKEMEELPCFAFDALSMEVFFGHARDGRFFGINKSYYVSDFIILDEDDDIKPVDHSLPAINQEEQKKGLKRRSETIEKYQKNAKRSKLSSFHPNYFPDISEDEDLVFDSGVVHDVLKIPICTDPDRWFNQFELIFIPVHGPGLSHTRDSCHRNHWSLLCYWPKENSLYHYDTKNDMNAARALEIMDYFKMFRVLPNDLRYIPSPEFIPVQPKGWECAHYIIYFVLIMRSKVPARPLSNIDFNDEFGVKRFQSVLDLNQTGSLFYMMMGQIVASYIEELDFFI